MAQRLFDREAIAVTLPAEEASSLRAAPSRPIARSFWWSRLTLSGAALRELLVMLFLCVVAIAATWPLARFATTALPDLGDPLDSAWRLSWPVHQLLHDPRHFFDANIYYPFQTSYLFDELILGVAIVAAPVLLLTGNSILAFNIALLFAFSANGIAAYWLGRHLTHNRLAACTGALVFAIAPFRLTHLGHIGLSSAYWLPLTLLFLDRLILHHRWRDAILFGCCAALQALSAQYYGFQIAFVVGLYILWATVRWPKQVFNPRLLTQLVGAIVLAELMLMPIVLPYISVKALWGYSRSLAENEIHSANLSAFLAVPPESLIARPLAAVRAAVGITKGTVWYFFPGLGALFLTLVGRWRRHHEMNASEDQEAPHDLYPFMVLLACFGAIMALGPALTWQQGEELTSLMPYRLFYYVIPGFDTMRAPERFGNVMLLGLSGAVSIGAATILNAFNWQHMATFWGRLVHTVGRVLVALLLLVAVGAEYAHTPLRPTVVPPMPRTYTWLAEQPPGVVIELPLDIPADQLNREQVRQYWSMISWYPRVNGSSVIVPPAYTALRQDLTGFPSERTVGLLQGLGVRYVVLHRDQYRALDASAIVSRAAQFPALRLRAGFDDTLIYEVEAGERFTRLQTVIPPGGSVFLSNADPARTGAYMAMIGWRLGAGHRFLTQLGPTFGPRFTAPVPGLLAEWVVCYRDEPPARYGYREGLPIVYDDPIVRIYHNAPAAPATATPHR